MDIFLIIINYSILFFLIVGAVRVGIKPLLENEKGQPVRKTVLNDLKVNGILNDKEIRKYESIEMSKREFEEARSSFMDSKFVLEQLLESGIIGLEDYNNRLKILSEVYHME